MEEPERRVAVVGDDDRAASLREAVRAAGKRVAGVTDPDATTTTNAEADPESTEAAASEPDATVAVGDAAVRDALRSASGGTVIPVGTHRLAFGVDAAASRIRELLDALNSSVDGVDRVTHPVLGVDTGASSEYRAVADVALVTEEPARISEFSVRFARGREASFRADGVVVATPFGSEGYANAAGGAVVEPGGGLSVVPIAPFSTGIDAWVAAERVTLSVERETESVALVVDGAVRETADPSRPVEIEVIDRVEALVPTAASALRARRSETL